MVYYAHTHSHSHTHTKTPGFPTAGRTGRDAYYPEQTYSAIDGHNEE